MTEPARTQTDSVDRELKGKLVEFGLESDRLNTVIRDSMQRGRLNWFPIVIVGAQEARLGASVRQWLKEKIALSGEKPNQDIWTYLDIGELCRRQNYAVTTNSVASVREKLTAIDFLVLENLQRFSSSTVTDAEFLAIWESFQSRGAWIVVTSTLLPHAVDSLPTNLVSRFVQGLVLQIPDAGEVDVTAVTPRKVISEVARALKLKPVDLKGTSRRQAINRARGIAIYLCRELLQLSFGQIGKEFGDRDHTTILHAFHRVEVELETDAELKQSISAIRARILS